jgi:hypothetical protein
VKNTVATDGFCGIAGRVCAQRHARGLMQATACLKFEKSSQFLVKTFLKGK